MDVVRPMTEEEFQQTAEPSEAGLGAMRTARGTLPLIETSIDARIIGLVVETSVRQTFVIEL